MSLLQFQSALAYIIRLPDQNQRLNFADIVSKYDLAPNEAQSLEKLAGHRLVKAYGEDMLEARWRIIHRVVACLYPLVSPELLKKLWRDDFEPKYYKTSFLDINTAFFEYLIEDPFAREQVLAHAPSCLPNVILYLYAVYYFSKGELPQQPVLPSKSHLEHGHFKILELDYDVRELCDALFATRDPRKTNDIITVEDAPETLTAPEGTILPVPEKRPLNLLFIATDVPTEFRSFEIDDSLKVFLQDQLASTQSCTLPECYEDLVDLGLCKPLGLADTMAEQIKSVLTKEGYFHLRESISDEMFQEVVHSLGTIVGTDQIKLNVTKRKLHSPEEIEFHTDSFVSDINAWRCEEPAVSGGATVLIDTAEFLRDFSAHETELLTTLEMECPNREHSTAYRKPLLTKEAERDRIFYTPWFFVDPPTDAHREVQKKFASHVEKMRKEGSIPVTLAKGECLFIDNKRMLHGRDALPPDTQRCLKRFWIATGSYDQNLMV
jgi:alpha-ketoglutarate-dependent taurine dioxygenase